MIDPDHIIVPVGRMGSGGPFNCSRGPLMHIIVPENAMGPKGPIMPIRPLGPKADGRRAGGGRTAEKPRVQTPEHTSQHNMGQNHTVILPPAHVEKRFWGHGYPLPSFRRDT